MRKVTAVATIATAVGGLAAGILPASSATASSGVATTVARPTSVCQQVRDCFVMGHRDVTGDGRRDWIGAVNHHSGRAIDDGAVTVRVLTAEGRLLRQRLPVSDWQGSVFQGIAPLDGRRGAEMVVGARSDRHEAEGFQGKTQTSYSKAFHVVTFRNGRLVRSPAPGQGSGLWSLTGPDGTRSGQLVGNASFTSTSGWTRRTIGHSAAMVREHSTCGGFAGCRMERTVYVWRDGRWVKKSTDTRPEHVDGGWHAPGLRVW